MTWHCTTFSHRFALGQYADAKAHPYLRRIPVVVLTSSNQPLDINYAYDLGASSYLVKLSASLKRYWPILNEHADINAPTAPPWGE